METNANLRGVRLSAQKGRLVADLVRGKPVDQALSILAFSPKKGAELQGDVEIVFLAGLDDLLEHSDDFRRKTTFNWQYGLQLYKRLR